MDRLIKPDVLFGDHVDQFLLQGGGGRGPKGPKGDPGPKGDKGGFPAYGPSAWRIYVDFSSTNPVEDGTEHNPYHSLAGAITKWATLTTKAHVLVGGSGGAEGDDFVIPAGCGGTIEGIERTWPTLGNGTISAGDNSGSGAVSFRNVGLKKITIQDRTSAQAGDLGIVSLETCWVTGGIESVAGLHTALVIASGLSRSTSGNMSPSMVLEGGDLQLRNGILLADNAKVIGQMHLGVFQLSNCLYYGSVMIEDPMGPSRFQTTEFEDPFVIDATAGGAEVHFDAGSAEKFGLMNCDCTPNVSALSNGFGPMMRRLSSPVYPFSAVRSTGALTCELGKGVGDNEVIGVCYPGRTTDQIALIWPSGTQIPAAPAGGSGTYYRDDGSGQASQTAPAGSQRLFHSDGAVTAVGMSYKES